MCASCERRKNGSLTTMHLENMERSGTPATDVSTSSQRAAGAKRNKRRRKGRDSIDEDTASTTSSVENTRRSSQRNQITVSAIKPVVAKIEEIRARKKAQGKLQFWTILPEEHSSMCAMCSFDGSRCKERPFKGLVFFDSEFNDFLCQTCTRHYRIFGRPWPSRARPASLTYNVGDVVFVDPKEDSATYWWVALVSKR